MGINMQDEYAGPEAVYEQLRLRQLRLPTVDHEEPSVEDLLKAVNFISEHREQKKRVYVHCKAGHGRAGAVAFAWMAYSRKISDEKGLENLNLELIKIRRVRKTLHRQPNIRKFAEKWCRTGATCQINTEDKSCAESEVELSEVRREKFE